MRTSSDVNISALVAICSGTSQVAGELPARMPVTWNFYAFIDLHLYERLSKQT